MKTVAVITHAPDSTEHLAALDAFVRNAQAIQPATVEIVGETLDRKPSWRESMLAAAERAISAEWLLFADPDTVLDMAGIRDYLDRMPSYMQAAIPYSSVFEVPEDQMGAVLQGRTRPTAQLRWKLRSHPGGFPLLVRRDVFLELGGYPNSSSKWKAEKDFAAQLRRTGKTKAMDTLVAYYLPVGEVQGYVAPKHMPSGFGGMLQGCLGKPEIAPSIVATQLPTEALPDALDDTALVISYAYEDAIRHGATLEALSHLADLRPRAAAFVLVQVVLPGDTGREDIRQRVEAAGGVYMPIYGGEQHRHVFHKEDVYNKVVLETLPDDIRYLVFLDADTYPEKPDWLWRTRQGLAERGDGVVMQPWSYFADTQDKRLSGPSMSKRIHDEGHWKNHANPGLSIAMTRQCFDDIGGFPTSCPVGAGDTMLVLEIYDGEGGPNYMHQFPYFKQSVRKVPHKDNAHIDARMVHVHHGPIGNRCYYTRHELLQAFWPFGDDLKLDEDGLLAVRPGSPIQYCMSRRREAKTTSDARALVRESLRRCQGELLACLPEFATKADFDQIAAAKPQYWKGRWPYHEHAISMLSSLDLKKQCLEIGSFGFRMIRNAEHMGLWKEDGADAIIHDAALEPWPFGRSRFGAVVALQVIEHLSDKKAFFRQACRVADWTLVSVPWQWTSGEPDHLGIDWKTLDEWTSGTDPWNSVLCDNRMLILYRSCDLAQHVVEAVR